MNTFHWILTAFSFIAVITLSGIFKYYLPSYFKTKAKNLATKEDISEITRKVEEVKAEYSDKLEHLRADLDKKRHVHQRGFDLELEVYRSLWKELVGLKQATAALRPIMDSILEPGESDEDRKMKRGKAFFESFTPLGKTIDENKPFYAAEVWSSVHTLRELAWKEALDYRFSDPHRDWEEYWKKAEKNMKEIQTISDNICEAIRSRVSHLNGV